MKINWKARFKNKTFVISLSALIIGFIYAILSAFDIVPSVDESRVTEIVSAIISLLGMLGVLVDPTTEGINDSARAMTYGTVADARENERGFNDED